MQGLHRHKIVPRRDHVPYCLRNTGRRKYTRAAYVKVHMVAGTVILRPIYVDIYCMVVAGIMRAMVMIMLVTMMRVIRITVIMRVHHRRRERGNRHREGQAEGRSKSERKRDRPRQCPSLPIVLSLPRRHLRSYADALS